MNTQTIIDAIYQDFTKTYRGAATFVNSGELWDFCIKTIKNPSHLPTTLKSRPSSLFSLSTSER